MRSISGPVLCLLLMSTATSVSLEEISEEPRQHSNKGTATLTLEILRRQNLWQSTVFVCDVSDGVQLLRYIGKNIQTSVISRKIESVKLNGARARLGVVVVPGSGCDRKSDSLVTLAKNSFKSHQNSTFRWLFINKSMQNVLSTVEWNHVRWDSSVTAIISEETSPDDRRVFDLYKNSPEENKLSAQQVGVWQTGSMKNWLDADNAPHRKNMHGYHITFGLTVTRHKEWDNNKILKILDLPPGDPRLPDDDCQLMPFHVLRITSEMFNYTLRGVNGYSGPGYPQPNGTYTQLLGAIQSGEVHCSATNLLIFNHRRSIVRYLGFCYYFRNLLIYLSSNTMSTPTALIQPFSPGLWIAAATFLLFVCILLVIVTYHESRAKKQPREISFGKSSLVVLGSLSGQGEPTNISSTSSYVIVLMILVFGVVINCAYSAVIVRFLLSEPSANFPTREHLMRSNVKVAAQDFFYYRNTVFGPNMSKIHREIYDRKMRPPGGFKKILPAVEGLLMGRWALLVPHPVLYPLVATATPQQKCRLFEIPDMPKLKLPLCPMIQKDSPLINMLNRGLTLLRERGFYGRYARIWFAPKPSCSGGGGRQWSPVALQVTYPAIGLMCGGLLGSIVLLLLENVYTRWVSANKNKATTDII